MQSLRPYQAEAVRKVKEAMRSSRSILLVMPTGSGKTTVVAHIAKDYPSDRVLVLVPARELVKQAAERFRENGMVVGELMGGRKPGNASYVIATVQSAARKQIGDFDLVIIDEAHRAVAAECSKVISRYPKAKILGITATPIRLDGKPLSKTFQTTLNPVTLKKLFENGYLVKLRVYAPQTPLELSRVKVNKRTRDYDQRSLESQYAKPEILAGAIENWQRYSGGKPTWIYCVSLEHAARVAEGFTRAGIPTERISGEDSPTRRAELFEALKTGKLKALTNVAVLTEGVDYPSLGCIVILRPTLSKGLHYQILGRGHRTAPNKGYCVVLDHADNFRRHGFPEEEDWLSKTQRVSNPGKVGKVGNPGNRVKRCPKCGALLPLSMRHCDTCGWEDLPVEGEGRLREVKPGSGLKYWWRKIIG